MRILRILGKFLKSYLIGVGLLAHVALAGAILYGLSQSQLTIRQLLVKAAQKGGIASPTLVEWIAPPARFTDFTLDGRLRAAHPRILLPELAQWPGRGAPPLMAERTALYKQRGVADLSTCSAGGILGATACWLTYGETAQAKLLLKAAQGFYIETPTVNGYGNSWALAFAYDFLRLSPDLPAADRVQIEIRIETALREALRALDESSASLWHGRSSLAAIAWLCAVVLDPGDSIERQQLIARAQGHFLETIHALALTEGWPEGYNYWVQERAFLIALAGSAYLNGLEDSRQADLVRKALRRVGYWTIYATRPDQRIEGLGDEGSRVDLKDETRRVIDLITQATRDPVLAGYSLYLEHLHGAESYYRDYRWGFNLFNDPTVTPVGGGALAGFNDLLPTAELFGQDSFNLAYIRSGWSPDATFISFRAGDTFTHHGHYDAGHFSLFKGAPLAINSSPYGDFFGQNRLNYAIRGVAKNTLLILRPGEKVHPNRFFNENVSDGGPRIIIPTGSAISSIQDWLENRNKGLYLEGGQLERFEHREGDYTYIAADLTAAYNNPDHDEGGWGGKVKRVQRQLLYLANEDRLLIRDRVRTVQTGFVKKWLLHTVDRPEVADLRILKGQPDNGILESTSDFAEVRNGRGWLTVQRILPEDAIMRLVGGRDYQYYVETDGDETELNGINFVKGSSVKPWFDIGLWRLEIQPGGLRQGDTFLVVLTPALNAPRSARAAQLALDQAGSGVVTDASATVFVDTPIGDELRLTIPMTTRTVRVIGLPPLARASLQMENRSAPLVESAASASGVAVFKSTANWQGRLVLRWQ
ncbi:MAG TPA: hypothetical protein PK018_13190 [Candidatus Competibacter sp.]|nr:hypothetical protein [Candidatus Competibacteraceae bacterium]MCP5133666.1 hypothetical protein [Gammaproteobacteria bacterium]HPE73102.1 hypothetical protein [Candidatus Competibacter sp.]